MNNENLAMKIEYEMIIDGLRGIPITGLVEGWEFTIKEIAPYVFRAEGRGPHFQEVSSFAGNTAEDALRGCVRRANKIALRESRRLRLDAQMSKIRTSLKNLFGRQK